MLILRPVQVKARVTSRLRAELSLETRKALSQVEEELEKIGVRLSWRKSSVSQASSPGVPFGRKDEWALLERQEGELRAKKEALLNRIRDIEALQDGQEIISNQVQSIQNVEVGDMWPSSEGLEIVLEDGKVIAIRRGNTVTVSVSEPAHGKKNDRSHTLSEKESHEGAEEKGQEK